MSVVLAVLDGQMTKRLKNRYDGADYEIKVDGVWYYCYGKPIRFTEWRGG